MTAIFYVVHGFCLFWPRAQNFCIPTWRNTSEYATSSRENLCVALDCLFLFENVIIKFLHCDVSKQILLSHAVPQSLK